MSDECAAALWAREQTAGVWSFEMRFCHGKRLETLPQNRGLIAAYLTSTKARATKPSKRGAAMSFNTFGHLFRFTSFGESHGAAIGCVVDGCPPRVPLKQEDIQRELDRRRPGQSRFTTQRQEPDAVKIMSGGFTDEQSGQQVTTGTPILLMIENVDQRSKGYSELKDKYRPWPAG